MAGAILGGGTQLPRSAFDRHLQKKIVGFGDGHEEASGRNGLNVRAIGGNDLHRPARIVQMVIGAGAGIDEPDSHALAASGRELCGWLPIRQKSIIPHIGQVHGGHPFHPALDHVRQGVVLNGTHNALGRALLDLLPLAPRAELGQHIVRALIGPVGEDHHEVVISFDPLAAFGSDDDAPVNAELLLQDAVGVIPKGAAVPQPEAILSCLARLDGGHVHMRNAVLVIRHQQAVPVDRGCLLQVIAHPQHGIIALGEAQRRAWQAAIDRHRLLAASLRSVSLGEHQIVIHRAGLSGGGDPLPTKQQGQKEEDCFHKRMSLSRGLRNCSGKSSRAARMRLSAMP